MQIVSWVSDKHCASFLLHHYIILYTSCLEKIYFFKRPHDSFMRKINIEKNIYWVTTLSLHAVDEFSRFVVNLKII